MSIQNNSPYVWAMSIPPFDHIQSRSLRRSIQKGQAIQEKLRLNAMARLEAKDRYERYVWSVIEDTKSTPHMIRSLSWNIITPAVGKEIETDSIMRGETITNLFLHKAIFKSCRLCLMKSLVRNSFVWKFSNEWPDFLKVWQLKVKQTYSTDRILIGDVVEYICDYSSIFGLYKITFICPEWRDVAKKAIRLREQEKFYFPNNSHSQLLAIKKILICKSASLLSGAFFLHIKSPLAKLSQI
ncbi:MAG: hypothetical protein K1060chlam2_00598 [Chlamydiae bacterium]|nr:hypothetical protein [Chlamydiota bacterium]